MGTQAGETAYYVDKYTDEVVPCDTTLEAWAVWLAAPDLDLLAPALDGDVFSISAMRFDEDIVARRNDGKWRFSRMPDGADFLAVRFGPGMGWDGDSIIFCGGPMGSALIDHMLASEDQFDDGEDVHIAVAVNLPACKAVFRAGPPPCLEIMEVH